MSFSTLLSSFFSSQFGKVERDVFTMDFRPKYLSPKQAFSVCLSSFDSKLSCF